MKGTIAGFLSEDEQARIVVAVEKAEAATAGEIVPMVVPYTYKYPSASCWGGFLLALAASVLVCFIVGFTHIKFFVPILCLFLALMYFVVDAAPFLKRLFVSREEMTEQVEEGAAAAFFRNEIFRTRDETGVLIYISIFERQVRIIADRGINNAVGQEFWDSAVHNIVEGIKSGRQADAIVRVIEDISAELSKHFPVRSDDKDELPNLIIGEK